MTLFAQMIYILVMSLLVLYLCVIIFRLLPLVTFAYQTLPFVPITKRGAKKLVRVPELVGKQKIVDLGCGRGTLLVEVRKQFPNSDLFGVEFKPSLANQTRWRCKFWKKPATIITGDMFTHDISQYDAIVGWWITSYAEKLMLKFAQEAKPGCVIVSFMFTLPDHPKFSKREIKDGKDKIFVYTKLAESQL